MRQHDWLFPHAFRKIGLATGTLLLVFYLVLVTNLGQTYNDSLQNWSNEKNWSGYTETITNVFIIGLALSLILVAFSREKQEDEMIQRLRLQALQWSVYVNYLVLMLCSLIFYWLDFLNVLIFNMYTILVFFIIMFRWTLHRMNKESLS
jgi:hypothetical protein